MICVWAHSGPFLPNWKWFSLFPLLVQRIWNDPELCSTISFFREALKYLRRQMNFSFVSIEQRWCIRADLCRAVTGLCIGRQQRHYLSRARRAGTVSKQNTIADVRSGKMFHLFLCMWRIDRIIHLQPGNCNYIVNLLHFLSINISSNSWMLEGISKFSSPLSSILRDHNYLEYHLRRVFEREVNCIILSKQTVVSRRLCDRKLYVRKKVSILFASTRK